ncbi:ArnT family glycosyltransferase [Paenibacillus chitinolyticus]|uniref:ArnT family glycosyltransferase n=1 Tax=Paenibacillus chitinolyticus TaxID=79263 RepID=UPI003631943D
MGASRLWKKMLIVFILALALGLRLFYVLGEQYEPVEYDQKNYTTMAVQMLEKGIYGYNEAKSNTLVTPGFPVFLAAILAVFGYTDIERTFMVVRVLQVFISLGAVWYIYKIGLRLFNRTTGLIAAFFASVYGTFIVVNSLILTEVIFLTSFMALIYYQVKIVQENRTRDHLLAGLLLALVVLIRPNTLVVAPVPYVFLWFQHKKPYFKEISFGVLAFALGMLPWWIRNAITFHEIIFISKGGAGNPLLGGTDPYYRGTLDWSKIDFSNQQGEAIKRIKEGLQTDPALWIRWFTVGKMKEMFLNKLYIGDYGSSVPAWYAPWIPRFHKFLVYAGMGGSLIAFFIHKSYRYLITVFLILLGTQLMFIPEARYTIGMMPFLMLIISALLVQAVSYAAGMVRGRNKTGSGVRKDVRSETDRSKAV